MSDIDIGRITEALNGKVDRDATNRSDAGSGVMAHMAMPSDTYVNLTLGASSSTYTAPADGYVKVSGVSTSSGAGQGWVYLESNNYFAVEGHGNQNVGVSIILPILKDTNFSLQYNSVTINHFRFYYAIGSESEA